MRLNWENLKAEFIKGFVNGEWASPTQFAIKKGLKVNGNLSKKTRGWKQEAQLKADAKDEQVLSRFTEKLINKTVDDWSGAYEKYTLAGDLLTGQILELLGGIEGTKAQDFTYLDARFNKRVDASAIKSLADSLIQVHNLLKKTYTKGTIPLAAENSQKIEEARQIKKAEDQQPNPDPTDGMSEAEIDKALKELEG